MSMEIVEGGFGEVFFFDDVLGLENDDYNIPAMWNEREVVVKHVKKAPHVQHLLAMMRAPDRGSISGGYSQEKGANFQVELNWDLPAHENSTSKDKEKEPAPREDRSSREENSSKKEDSYEQDEDNNPCFVIIANNAKQWYV